jgi:cyclohexyl-isocyanide hydratase
VLPDCSRADVQRRIGAYTDLLPLVGATYEKARVVRDGNVITAGGVTSGIDFGLNIVADIAGEATARTIQLGIEYDPAPPFDSGHPDRAPVAIKSALGDRYRKANLALRAGIEQAANLPSQAAVSLTTFE